MSDLINGDIEHERKNWTPFEIMLEENKELKIKSQILEENYDRLIQRINALSENIDSLVENVLRKQYKVLMKNNDLLDKIYQEIDSINMYLTAKNKNKKRLE